MINVENNSLENYNKNIKDIIEIKNLFWAIEGCFIEEIQREDIPPLIN